MSRVPGGRVGGGWRGAREVAPKFLGGGGGPLEIMKLDVRRATNWRRFDDPTFLEALRAGNVPAMGSAFADSYINGVFRLLSAEDQLFKGPIIQRSLVAQARARSLRAGARGSQVAREAKKILENPTDQMWLQAFQHADEATFQNATRLGDIASAAVRSAPFPLDLIIPFQRTPGAIATRILEMSPLGLVAGSAKMARVIFGRNSMGVRALHQAQREAAELLGRSATGFGFVGLGWVLADYGLAVGKGPDYGTAERVAFDLAGMQENSLLIGGEWWNANRLAPGGSLLALGASLRQLYGDGDRTSLEGLAGAPFQVAVAAFGGVLDLPFLQGLNELQRIARNPDEQAPEFIGEMAASTIPFSGALGSIARTIDPSVREATEGNIFKASVMSRLPLLSQNLPHKTNALGEELVRKPGKWHTLLNPFSPREFDKRPWVRELVRLGGGIPRIERAETETLEQYQYRLRQFGEVLQPVMERAINTQFYREGVENSATMFGIKPDLWRKAILEELIKMVRSNVAMVQRPELVRQLYEQQSREQILANPFQIPTP